MKHTPAPWITDGVGRQEHGAIGVFQGEGIACVALVAMIQPGCLPDKGDEDAGRANAALIALAPTAPHECDADCPGDINRRKLALLDEMVAALGVIHFHLAELGDAWERGALDEHGNSGGTRSNRNEDRLRQVRALLARAREIEAA